MATELKELHLADLRERAAAAGVRGYRMLRREELITALSDAPTPSRRPGTRSASREQRVVERPPAEQRPRSGIVDDEADTDELVALEATVLDDAAEPVESGSGSDDGDDEKPTEVVRGVLELTRQRYGFLRLLGLEPQDGDVYISAAQVRRCELRSGDEVSGPARAPRRGERHRAIVHVDLVNGHEPLAEERIDFDALAAVIPERRIELGAGAGVLLRAVDLLAPLAFGQRVLVRAASRSGRTTLLHAIARAAAAAETAKVIVLLIDESPEAATTWRESLPVAEFAIATGEMAAVEQLRVAELALERARRVAESGRDAVLVCDSLSRLAFAAGGGAEVKRLFGSGRNLAGAGSLTVVATVLSDALDQGEAGRAVATTESSLVVLDPDLAAAGVTPAIRAAECRISNEDQIRDGEELDAARKLRALLSELKPSDAAALLRERLEATASNAELLRSL